MSKQLERLLTKAILGTIRQGRRASVSDMCSYVVDTEDGECRCVVGQIMPDDLMARIIDVGFNTTGVYNLTHMLPLEDLSDESLEVLKCLGEHETVWSILQRCHDGLPNAYSQWPLRFARTVVVEPQIREHLPSWLITTLKDMANGVRHYD